MRISTGSTLLGVLSVDHATGIAFGRGRKRRESSVLTMIGQALAVGGPLIAALIGFVKTSKDEKEQEAAKAANPEVAPDLVPKPLSLTVTPPAVEPAAGAPTSTAPKTKVNRGSKLAKSDIVEAIQRAANKTNEDYATMYAIAGAESSFRADAQASTSSAAGLFQFTKGTWAYMLEKYPDLGYTAEDRTDPEKAATMAALYIKSLKASLQRILGRAPSVKEIYLAYFLGPSGAQRFFGALASKPKALASDLFPKQAEANPNLFYEGGDPSKPLTMEQVFAKIGGKVEKFYADVAPAKTTPAPVTIAASNLTTVTGPAKVALPTATTQPVVQQITAAALPSPEVVAKATAGNEGPSVVGGGSQPAPRPSNTQFVRDRHGRLLALSG